MRSHPSHFEVVFVVIRVQLTPPETTVAVVVLDVVVDVVVVANVVVFVNVVILALLVVTDHILFTCGQ